VVNIQDVRADQVELRVDPLSELGALLHAVTHGDHHPRARQLRERIQEERPTELLSQANRFRPLFGTLRARFLLPWDSEITGADLGAQIAALDSIPVQEFVHMAAVALIEQARDFDFRGQLGSAAARRQILGRVERISISRVELTADLFADPEGVRRQFQDFLTAAATAWFDEEWSVHCGALRDEAALRRREVDRHGAQALTGVSSIARLQTQPDRVVFDKVNVASCRVGRNRLLLVPSYHCSPHLIVKHDLGYPIVVQYEIGALAQDSLDAVHDRLVVLHDRVRVQMCRRLLRIPSTTVDLSIQFQMTQPQVSRHLRALRQAGLVQTQRQGRHVYYSLDTAAIRSLGTQLLAALYR
jgi:DNA-binding transcriptional ArsR family regulator